MSVEADDDSTNVDVSLSSLSSVLCSVRMEDEMLTAVTQKAQVATVAPLPSISNRLSVADFQKISTDSDGNSVKCSQLGNLIKKIQSSK